MSTNGFRIKCCDSRCNERQPCLMLESTFILKNVEHSYLKYFCSVCVPLSLQVFFWYLPSQGDYYDMKSSRRPEQMSRLLQCTKLSLRSPEKHCREIRMLLSSLLRGMSLSIAEGAGQTSLRIKYHFNPERLLFTLKREGG